MIFRLVLPHLRIDSRHQSGQALVEALIALSALLLVWTAVAWLGRYQDIALQASHASRHAAFAQARGEAPQGDVIKRHYFTGSAHRWTDRRGMPLLAHSDQITVDVNSGPRLEATAQPGRVAAHAQALREQWLVEDAGIVDARIRVAFSSRQNQGGPSAGVFRPACATLTRLTPRLCDTRRFLRVRAMRPPMSRRSSAWPVRHWLGQIQRTRRMAWRSRLQTS